MNASPAPSGGKVTFIVPTLNRVGTVLRAVDSCLAAMERAGWAGTVSVLDSESDDGSWQALTRRFGDDPRVLLRQNRRGLGPTRSWLDGGEGTDGDAVTFAWSDDYLSPGFLTRLGGAVSDGAAVAIGVGLPRPVECAEPLPDSDAAEWTTAGALLDRHFTGAALKGWDIPVTPTCALFRGAAFRHWAEQVERICSANPLRRDVMWRRAIGPDLLLFLIALSGGPNDRVYLTRTAVAQLSVHPDSITISSSSWDLSLGYWLAKAAYLIDPVSERAISGPRKARYAGVLITRGAWLWYRAPRRAGVAGRGSARPVIAAEIRLLNAAARGHRIAQMAAMFSFLARAILRRVVAAGKA